ncbi:MAG: ribonuclease HI [Gammaproteobacteria bacterium]|nr:ribonuclease HI [Gammaproteobacteria bacterium]
MQHVEIFTDGACRGNPGPGGWGVILKMGDNRRELFGGEATTTNNRMELTAAIQGLAQLKRPCQVTLTTDSRYVMDGITKWLAGWKRNGWKTAAKQPVKNIDLWQQLETLCQQHLVNWQWVKGHTGHDENECADRLANQGIDNL